MNIGLLVLIFFTKSYSFEDGLVDCKINDLDLKKEYITYFKKVTNHIQVQLQHLNLEHISIRIENDKIISIQDYKQKKFNGVQKTIKIYFNIVDLINYLFVDVLQKFTEHLKIIIDNCKHFFEENSFENAIYCTVVLLNAAKNSNMMFEYLYKAISFIDHIDTKLVLSNSLYYSNTVIEEIYSVKHYTYQMKTPEIMNYVNNDGSIKIKEVKEDYNDINNFVDEVVAITREFFKNNVTIINSANDINIREKYYCEYYSNNCNMKLVDFISEKLKNYYLQTITDYYLKIGFHELLHPSTTELTPPQKYNLTQKKAIQTLNILFREIRHWKLLNHIKIIIDDEIITTDRIIRDTVDNFNFNKKKKCFTQLIRCRYTEVLKNYNTYMSAIIKICRIEKSQYNLDCYVDCIINFLDAVKNSKEMFKNMLLALDILKAETIWNMTINKYSSLSYTYNLLNNFFPKIEQLTLTKNDFLNLSVNEVILKARTFLLDFSTARNLFSQGISDLSYFINVQCFFDIVEKNQLIESWETEVLSLNNNITGSPILLYEYALGQFRIFYGVAITSEYNCLGFNKIDSSN
ncbi:uncharacterized protein LOC126896920 [Daktulosphaira vitifoliae]|uniref:uncharacterized protein LOC126896920 n=1 Tax=Daktulosphaira vitifoliae TaxID=58002 RepID=UPI0021A990B6|nr:uncharacterized protein LOC126896920 [Daktulosphaira vitifoliae]